METPIIWRAPLLFTFPHKDYVMFQLDLTSSLFVTPHPLSHTTEASPLARCRSPTRPHLSWHRTRETQTHRHRVCGLVKEVETFLAPSRWLVTMKECSACAYECLPSLRHRASACHWATILKPSSLYLRASGIILAWKAWLESCASILLPTYPSTPNTHDSIYKQHPNN